MNTETTKKIFATNGSAAICRPISEHPLPWTALCCLLGLVQMLLAAPSWAQWTQQSALPTFLEIHGVAAPAGAKVFLATDDDGFDDGGALFESTDGGATWIHRDVPFSLGSGLFGIYFLDAQHGWVWGNENYRTTDGGTTWSQLPSLGSAYFMRFYTTDFGLTTGNFGAYTSTDGGLSWSPSPQDMFSFDFTSPQVGLGASDTGLYRTADGGSTFSLVFAGGAKNVAYLSPSVAVGVVDNVFVHSTDGGQTWTTGGTAAGRTQLTPISASVVLAWSGSGLSPGLDNRFLRSEDGGQTWADLGDVTALGARAVTAVTSSKVVAADHGGNLFYSADAGLTWAQTFQTPGPRPGFFSTSVPVFSDSQTGYFAYGAGFVLGTTDGGATWSQISSGAGQTINALDRFPNGDLIAVGDGGQILTSAAGNLPWLLRDSVGTIDLEAVQILGAREIVSVDRQGLLYRSTDRGDSWVPGAALPMPLTAADLHFESPLDGWIVGAGFAGAALFHTLDGGSSWTPVTDFQGTFVAVDFVGSNGWVAGSSGITHRTGDGGSTWVQGQLPGSSLTVRDMEFHDASIGYAVGGSGYAVRTSDGGSTWQTLPTPSTEHELTDIYLIGPDEVWVSTRGGVALYSATGGQNWAVMDTEPGGGSTSYSCLVASPAGDAWMGGWRGTLQHFAGPPPSPVNRPPEASYDFVSTGLSVAFTDTSTDPDGSIVSWLWDFGDGSTSTQQSPTHEFASADTYHVRLIVTDDDGDDDSYLRFIAVQPGPGGTFGDFTEVTPLDPLFVTPQEEDFWVTTTAPADFDGDGDLDIAVLGFYVVYNTSVDYRLVLLRNDGAAGPEEWEFEYLDVPLGDLSAGASDLAWGDPDGDGDPDLAVGTNGETVIYRNDAGTLLLTDSELPGYGEDNDQADFDLRSITWVDYDNDGDDDLLLPSIWDGGTFTYRTALMRNDGANGTGGWTFVEENAGLAGTRHAQSTWADYDGDQDLDLLLVHLAPLTNLGFIRRYRNDGNGNFVGEDILGALALEHGEAQWGDYDEDGDLDILLAGHIKETDGSFSRALRIYRNDEDTHVPVEVIDCPTCEGWFDLTAASWADYDSDGDMDILLAGSYNSGSQIEGRAKIYTHQGGVFSTSESQLPAPQASGSRGGTFSWLDIDRDGDLDYFIAGQYYVPGGNGLVEAQMHLYRNDVQGQNGSPTQPTLLSSQVSETGDAVLWWNPAADDLTPAHALTYDLRLYRNGIPESIARRVPEPGGVSAVNEWTFDNLPEGFYSWTLQAIDSAYNSSPSAEAEFIVGDPVLGLLFEDGFESGDLQAWVPQLP